LRAEQRQVVPESFDLVECDFASGLYGLVSPPGSYCVYLVEGTTEAATATLAQSLSRRGYRLRSDQYSDGLELRGKGPEFDVHARIGRRAPGPHLVPRLIPAGAVAVSVTIGVPESSSHERQQQPSG
jgi:hypothetical protein